MPPPTSHDPSVARLVDALESALTAADHEERDTQIGHYKLIQKIGTGGFGSVWMADQLEPVRRRVALKIIKAGMDTEEVIARFEAERQALALMDHPNIARVFEAGATAGGRPYFVMELVRGVPITYYCDENRLSAAERLRLFIAVCQAVQHAHQKGVIHRDLKPSNILVTLHDGVPVPKVIDFGIAKAIDRKLTEKTFVTQFHAFVGTPVYTSPEQAEMSGLDIDTRSDVYSLGVLLYELLAGRPPFEPATLLNSGLDAMRRMIREVDPPRPSQRLGTLSEADRTSVAERRRTDAARLQLLLRGDVDWIVMRCLEKDRTRRYETANALAMDIQRHLQDEPIVARPPSASYRIGKFVRRHRVVVAAVSAVAVSLVGGLIASSTLFVRERAAHQRASAAEQAESRLRQQAESARTAESRRASRTSQALAEQLLQESRTGEALAHLVRAAKSDPENFTLGPQLISAIAYRNFALPVGEPITDVDNAGYTNDGRRIWIYRADRSAGLRLTPGTVTLMMPRYQRYPADGVIEIRDLADARVLFSFRVAAGGRHVESADGQRLAIGADRSVTVFNAATGRAELGPIDPGAALTAIGLSPDGRWLVTGATDGGVKIWEVATGKLRATLPHSRAVGSFTFNAAGDQVVTRTGSNGHWRAWRLPEGEPVFPQRPERMNTSGFLFSPDGGLLATMDNDGAYVLEFRDDFSVERQLYHGAPCNTAAFSPDGKLLATASTDATVRLWEMPSGKPKLSPLAHGGGVRGVHFTADGRYLVTSSAEGTARLWDVSTGRLAQEPISSPRVLRTDLARHGGELLTVGEDRTARRWTLGSHAVQPLRLTTISDGLQFLIDRDAADTGWVLYRDRVQKLDLLSGWPVGEARRLPATLNSGQLAPGAGLAFVHTGTSYEIWDLRTPEIVRRPLGEYRGLTGRFSPDATRFAGVDAAFDVRVWDAASGRLLAGPIPNGSGRFTFSPENRLLAVAVRDNTVVVWDLVRGSRIGEPIRHDVFIGPIKFSPDGRVLVTASMDGTVRLTDSRTVLPLGPPLIHRHGVNTAAFTRDSRRLLTGNTRESNLWDVATGTPASPPITGGNDLVRTEFTHDETRLATVTRGAEVRIHDARTGVVLLGPLRLGNRMNSEQLQLFGEFMATTSGRGRALTTQLWPLPPAPRREPVPEWLLRLATALAGGEIDAGANFREQPFNAKAFDEIRRELASLPREAAFAEWGRWFLADRGTRPIAPGFRITAAEAEQLARHAVSSPPPGTRPASER